ncbi:MAG: PVC-type heme-binding CxxCH protein [Verrucomicrobiales bacterium]
MNSSAIQRFVAACALFAPLACSTLDAAEPLRVFIRGGKKSHGPGAHEHEQFLKDWTALLNQRGAKCEGAMDFPTAEQLDRTDVLVLYAQEGGTVVLKQRSDLDKFLARGGGVAVIHTAAVSHDAEHWKSIIGGAWVQARTKWLEGPMSLYFSDREHPITAEASNYDLDDEIYYDLDLSPDIRVLAAAWTPNPRGANARAAERAQQLTGGGKKVSVYDIQPQIWTYERTLDGAAQPYRAFVHIPGHLYKNFSLPQFRAVLLRGVAWAGKRENVDELCAREELAALRYPAGGPSRPEDALKKIEVHPEFELQLIAAEPLINKPINIDWDPQGRLWVAETPEYPNGRRQVNVEPWKDSGSLEKGKYDRPARDRISILSDSDNDGRMDKKHVFFEGLELVTSFVFYKDGVIACAAPDVWWIRDTDGDEKAETVTKLYTGLGIGDTHAVINNLRWGLDGWIYATHGYSDTNDVKSGDGARHFGRIGSGVVRFKPDGSGFEQYSSKGGNTWGLDVAWDGEVFYTQPTSGDLLMHIVMPESALARGSMSGVTSFKPLIVREKSFPVLTYDQQAYVQIDVVGGFTASAGCAIYDGSAWPPQWRTSYFTTEPTINVVHHEIVSPSGVSYRAARVPERAETEFMRGRDYWFRPIETRIGPDDALFLCDFYNQAVIHNDTRGPQHGPANAAVRPDRDHYFGRLYRVQHKQSVKFEIPNLKAAPADNLIVALEHPNRHVRFTALRLLSEGKADAAPAIEQVFSSTKPASTRLLALWALHRLGSLKMAALTAALNDPDAAMRKNAAFIAAEQPSVAQTDLIKRLDDAEARVRLAALLALGGRELESGTAKALIAAIPKLDDGWMQSALLGAGAKNPSLLIEAAFSADKPQGLDRIIERLAAQLAASRDGAQAGKVIVSIAGKPDTTLVLKQAVLKALSKSEFPAPELTPELSAALQKLVTHSATAASALPLAARWDKSGALTAEVKKQIGPLQTKLGDTSRPEAERQEIITTLLGLVVADSSIIPAVAALLTSEASPSLKRHVIAALGTVENDAAGQQLATLFPQLDPALQDAALDQVLKRSDWTLAFLDSAQAGSIDLGKLSPANKDRLRNHPGKGVARRVNSLMAQTSSSKEKDAIIAKLIPLVTQPGDAAKGKPIFTVTCAICHKFGDLGRDAGPTLEGMGAHGPADLLVHIVDPNREVDPSFRAWNFELKNGQFQSGIIARENPKSVVVRNQVGEIEIAVDDIKSRQDTGRSLMPEGFEALGGEMLRDMLAFVCGSETRFRFLDLSKAYTADGRRGLFGSEENERERVQFAKFGTVTVEGVPFYLADPVKAYGGRNLVVLRGGPRNAFSQSYPQRVEVSPNVTAAKLHFLSGVGGWAWPWAGDDTRGQPAMKVTLQYAGGGNEEIVLKNGEHFADYVGEIEVPGSKLARGVAFNSQIRHFSLTPQRREVISRIVLESANPRISPVVAAITAELPAGPAGSPTPASKSAEKTAPSDEAAPNIPKIASGAAADPSGGRVLLAGGGSAHDFQKWFNERDVATLKAAGFSPNYTENPETAAAALHDSEVFVMSTNQAEFSALGFRRALDDFLNAGKGVIFLHAGVWYNFRDWPEFNKTLVGGGARGHDKLGEFEVSVVKPDHPAMAGLPPSFKITDELYYVAPEEGASPFVVLAKTSVSQGKKQEHPSVWTVPHAKGRILCVALGHDGRSHDLPEFQKLLVNGVKWAAGKPAPKP